jgi:hypothetical protein
MRRSTQREIIGNQAPFSAVEFNNARRQPADGVTVCAAVCRRMSVPLRSRIIDPVSHLSHGGAQHHSGDKDESLAEKYSPAARSRRARFANSAHAEMSSSTMKPCARVTSPASRRASVRALAAPPKSSRSDYGHAWGKSKISFPWKNNACTGNWQRAKAAHTSRHCGIACRNQGLSRREEA